MLDRIVASLRQDPHGFIPRALSAASERLRPRGYRLKDKVLGSDETFLPHYGVHRSGNCGDTALFVSTRKIIDHELGQHRWRLMPVRERVLPEDIATINKRAPALVLGGGGLILKDSVPGSASGWQWNIPLDLLRQLERPIIAFAIGYNRFSGQDEFASQFREHITETIAKSAFFGLRNRGSIAALSEYLSPELAAKLKFQPCPTTMISRFHPINVPRLERVAAVNLAFDRAELRFKDGVGPVVEEIADCLKWLTSKGWRLVVTIHDPRDRYFLPFLRSAGVRFTVHDMPNASFEEVVNFYAAIPLTLGMRGHGQMVPFGVGNAIFSLVSHPKLAYFLNDIGKPEWQVDVQHRGFKDAFIARLSPILDDVESYRAQVAEAQTALYTLPQENIAQFAPALSR